MSDFTLTTTVDRPHVDTVERVRALLGDAGFGVLTEIDMRAVLQAKLGVTTPPRVILGACRPDLAHRAVEADPRIAAVLPCNVVISAVDDTTTRVDIFDPLAMVGFVDDPGLAEVAADARERLGSVIERLTEEEVSHGTVP